MKKLFIIIFILVSCLFIQLRDQINLFGKSQNILKNQIVIEFIENDKRAIFYKFSKEPLILEFLKKIKLQNNFKENFLNLPLPSGTLVVLDGDNFIVTRMNGKNLILFGLPIDINRASIDDLIALPSIGKKIAKNIIKYRNKIGTFLTLEGLKNVSGIGTAKFNKINKLVTIGFKTKKFVLKIVPNLPQQ